MSTKNPPKIPQKFLCETCDYSTGSNKDFKKHLLTAKHNLSTKSTQKSPKIPTAYFCNCGKNYKERSGLWRHKKKCKEASENSQISEERKIDANLVRELIEQNKDLQNQIIEMASHKHDNVTINNTQNNNFNVNMFLNVQCKDAINFTDFIERIEVSHDDLENNAQLGFVNGISKILLDNLQRLTLYERPIHCTDVKRETMYIKDDNQWQKDVTDKINSAIQGVSQKSIITLMDWKKNNPDYQDIDSEFSNKCIVMQQQSIAGDKHNLYYSKVTHNIAKENVLKKDMIQKM